MQQTQRLWISVLVFICEHGEVLDMRPAEMARQLPEKPTRAGVARVLKQLVAAGILKTNTGYMFWPCIYKVAVDDRLELAKRIKGFAGTIPYPILQHLTKHSKTREYEHIMELIPSMDRAVWLGLSHHAYEDVMLSSLRTPLNTSELHTVMKTAVPLVEDRDRMWIDLIRRVLQTAPVRRNNKPLGVHLTNKLIAAVDEEYSREVQNRLYLVRRKLRSRDKRPATKAFGSESKP